LFLWFSVWLLVRFQQFLFSFGDANVAGSLKTIENKGETNQAALNGVPKRIFLAQQFVPMPGTDWHGWHR